ncbi:hypothetical protein [Urechidicola vernalis]|uniref:Uncharacterized protein n=1 Tax=Urechidicola vernalis TaxID=3075600 RepID=A0ABU2Y6D2_9FLAO|nr:hypothetical protein [Urechidicola sp. P050]MDT0553602.1 hypothetical protein [Urechidicola sp. P050]
MILNLPQFKSIFLFICLFFSIGAVSQTTINSEDFNSNWGDWNSGGGNAVIRDDNRPNTTDAVRLRNGTGTSNLYSDYFDLSSYSSVSITFDFEFRGMEDTESFVIEYDDGDGSWQELIKYEKGNTGFENNDTEYIGTYTLDSSSYDFSSGTSRFRIRIDDANANNDRVYIDNIVILGFSGGGGGLSYCESGGYESDGWEDVIRQVQFSDINNSSPLNEN